MSETPISPVLDQKSEQNNNNGEHYHTGNIDQKFASWEHGFDTDSRLDLERDDIVRPEFWTDNSVQFTQAPEYAAQPKTHIESVSQSIEGLSDSQMREALDAHGKAIVNGLRKHVLAA